MCVQYRGWYHEYRGGYYDARGGDIIMHVGDIVSTVGENLHYHHSNRPLGHRMERHTCMGTHHLNNYHHNSKSIAIMWGFVWDPFKRFFGQQTSHMGPTCTSVLGQLPHCHHYSRPCGYRVELHMRPAWTSVWGSFHTIVIG